LVSESDISREPLNERRIKLVEKAWRKLDPEHSGWTNVRILCKLKGFFEM